MINVIIFFTSLNGVKTFTANLIKGIQQLDDIEVRLLKLGKNTENFYRHYAQGVHYRNISWLDLVKMVKSNPSLITTTSPKFHEEAAALVQMGARVVIHSNMQGDLQVTNNEPLVMRRTIKRIVPGSVLMKHPYVSQPVKYPKTKHAIAPTRLAAVKHTEMILDAILEFQADIDLYGDLMPFYGMYLRDNYPEWKHVWKGKFDCGEGRMLIAPYRYMIDLTDTGPDDGGEVQYSFLEAMDTGTIPVIYKNWEGGPMVHGKTCWVVDDAEQLKHLPKRPPKMDFTKILNQHDAKKVAKQWVQELVRKF